MTERATNPSPWTFDPVTLGRRECDAWAAYCRHEWPQFLTAAVGMISTGFGMNRRRTITGAWHVLRANQAWAPYPVNDPAAAREHMQRFYTLVADSGSLELAPARVAQLEVEWCRVHREHQHNEAITGEELTDTLNALYSYVYDVPTDLTRPASALRVKADGPVRPMGRGGLQSSRPPPRRRTPHARRVVRRLARRDRPSTGAGVTCP